MRYYSSLLVVLLLFAAPRAPANEPIPIANRTCLFLDDRFIAEQSGLKRVWHQGKPRPEPAIQAERQNPWEKWPHMFGSVIRDPKDGFVSMDCAGKGALTTLPLLFEGRNCRSIPRQNPCVSPYSTQAENCSKRASR
jgi:hypothetical protein